MPEVVCTLGPGEDVERFSDLLLQAVKCSLGSDLAKNVIQVHGVDADGKTTVRRQLRRSRFLASFEGRPRCLTGMEACASAHDWARAIHDLGHDVRFVPPAYVKPFVKRQKSDAADAEAIAEAATRPTMRFVAVKSKAKQASSALFRTRDLVIGHRTQIINALRGHSAEYGLIAPQGASHIRRLIAQIEDPASDIPEAARTCLFQLVETRRPLDDRIKVLDALSAFQ